MSFLVTIVALFPTRREAEAVSRSFGTVFRNLDWDIATMSVLAYPFGFKRRQTHTWPS
jgi:hypothetical protein